LWTGIRADRDIDHDPETGSGILSQGKASLEFLSSLKFFLWDGIAALVHLKEKSMFCREVCDLRRMLLAFGEGLVLVSNGLLNVITETGVAGD
jgi:hypothetical protein